MRRKEPVLEWITAEDEGQWQRALVQASPAPAASGIRPRRRLWLVGGLALLLACLASAGGWFWYQGSIGLAQIDAELRDATRTELWAAQSGLGTLTTEIGTPDVWQQQFGREAATLKFVMAPGEEDRLALLETEVLALSEGSAAVRVVTSGETQGQAFRQTRFYRQSEDGWVRTVPDPVLWGAPERLLTDYFDFRFQSQDAAVVAEVAPQVDALYAELRHNFGLSSALDSARAIIEIDVARLPGTEQYDPDGRYRFPSPALYLKPIDLQESELLAQSILLVLLRSVEVQMSDRHPIERQWLPLVIGLRLWQIWSMDLPLSDWREDVVRWLHTESGSQGSSGLPKRYDELCATHRLWMSAPAKIGIPLICEEADRTRWLPPAAGPDGGYTQLDQFPIMDVQIRSGSSVETVYRLYEVHHTGKAVALATLFDYAVSTYGKERLPLLIAGLGRYHDWQTLLEAVYGVSAVEFEMGWQAYLHEQYR